MEYCKLSDYAKKYGVTYRTAFNRFRAGKITGAKRDSTGHICVPIVYLNGPISNDVVIYASVSSSKDSDVKKLDEQVKLLTQFCNARGYHIEKVVREISSSIHGERPKLNEIFKDRNAKHIVAERKSNIARFGYEYIETLLAADQRQIEVMNDSMEDKDTLIDDAVKYIYAICRDLGTRKIPKKNIKALLEKFSLGVDVSNVVDELS